LTSSCPLAKLDNDLGSCFDEGACVMGFPKAEREIYGVNPLDEVICQLRFPPVLRIDSETPAVFQERLRANYPFYTNVSGIPVIQGFPAGMIEKLGRDFPTLPNRNHEFASADRRWTLTLTRESLTLSCKRYEQWEGFRDRLCEALNPLLELYSPNFFVRLGLRYRNLIRRSRLGLHGRDWSELLEPWILGAYSSPDIKNEIEMNSLQMVIRLPENGGRVLASCGVVKTGPPEEECYLIDADFFIGQPMESFTEPKHALERFDALNIQSHLFFRWCIRDSLHRVLLAPHRVP
jgi:uncharacterized protein (TIGR04255 family)